jgi:hypothetical protein
MDLPVVGSELGITRELNLGEVLSKTYELYRRNFVNFVLLFAVVELVIGVIGAIILAFAGIAIGSISIPLGSGFAIGSWFATLGISLLLSFLVAVIFIPVAEGATIKMTSEEINGQKIDLMAAVSFAFSRLLSLWAIFIVVGIIVILGLVALILPGIILAIMFALSIPVLLLEQKGVFDSMSRSRQLVGGRWLRTFNIFFVLGVFIGVVSFILGLISLVAGPGSGILSSILSALYQPVIPIALTVYYYSNVARTSGAQPGQPTMAPPAPTGAAPGTAMKFCPSCGTQIASSAVFCPKCGARQP